MRSTADSSVIVALYLNEANSPLADALCASVPPPLFLTEWHRVEIANAFQRAIKAGRITVTQAGAVWSDFTADIAAGRFRVVGLDYATVLSRTLAMSERWTAALGTRTLDLIHIAAALEIQATEFLTFDIRQREAAMAEGLNVLP